MTLELYNEPTHAIAESIKAELAKLDWPTGVVLRYVTVPELDAEDLGREVHILVGGEGTDAERSSRGATAESPKVVYAVRARCKADDTERFRYLQSIAYTVGRQVLQMRGATIGGTPVIVSTNVSHDIDQLRKGEFITVRTVRFAAQRELAG